MGGVSVRINTELKGEPARVLLELKQRGLVGSNREAIAQGILALYEKVLQRDLSIGQIMTIKRAMGETD